MPLYEYQCDTCGHRFETIQKFSDPLVDKCPVCGAHVHKLPSSPAIQFKGSGFYITDYPKKDQGGTSKTESAESTGESKSESKTPIVLLPSPFFRQPGRRFPIDANLRQAFEA